MQEKKRLILNILFILIFAIINLIIAKPVQATTQEISTNIDNIDEEKYPGVKQMIKNLQEQHSNWNFKILYTDIDWYEAIKNEYVGHYDSPRNMVPVSNWAVGEWICEICKSEQYYDNGKWRCASEKTIKYMMDARNSINNSDVFQFMELTYQENTKTDIKDDIKSMVENTFLNNDSYIDTILKVGKKYNVSPYYIVALIIQEQGASGSDTISGTYPGYEGYYNIFNINASGNGNGTIIANALSYAKNPLRNWNTIEKSIEGGVESIAASYISKGQNTLYLQKFDVDNSDGKLYWHQYQQNVMAAQNEGVTIRKTFEEIDSINAAYTFIIPLYKNMPKEVSAKPDRNAIINLENTEKVRVNVNSSINLRATPNGDIINQLYADEIVYRLEKGTELIYNTYWDKVMKENGIIGYVARETYQGEKEYKLYLIPIGETTEAPTPPEEEPEENEEPEEEKKLTTMSNEKIKIDSEIKQITIIPGTTLQEIIDLSGVDIKAVDKLGNLLGKTSIPGTGSKINDEYTVVLIGDTSGDGIVDSRDSLRILKYVVDTYELKDEFAKAGDLNNDGIIDGRDSLRILKYSVGTYEIKM